MMGGRVKKKEMSGEMNGRVLAPPIPYPRPPRIIHPHNPTQLPPPQPNKLRHRVIQRYHRQIFRKVLNVMGALNTSNVVSVMPEVQGFVPRNHFVRRDIVHQTLEVEQLHKYPVLRHQFHTMNLVFFVQGFGGFAACTVPTNDGSAPFEDVH